MKNFKSKRWVVIHKVTGKSRGAKTTRAAARDFKRSTERIYDMTNGVYVR
jgi:hypothetical protein